ncbi:MAG: DEAD/DEAH box helicase [Sarcina sp.]
MRKEELLKIFKTSTTGRKHIDAIKVIENDLISDLIVNKDEFTIRIDSNVISDNLLSSYKCELELDIKTKNVLSTYCTCDEYEKFEFSKKNYCCKHLIASFYNGVNQILEFDKNITLEKYDNKKNKFNNSILDLLLIDVKKEILLVEVYIEKDIWNNSIKSYFKIINDGKGYIIRDLEQFLVHYENKIPLHFGKNFIFDLNKYKLSAPMNLLINFLKTMVDIESNFFLKSRKDKKFLNGKYLNIPSYMLKEFFENIAKNKIFLSDGFFSRDVEAYIIKDNPPLNLSITYIDNGDLILNKHNSLPFRFNDKSDIFILGNNIYMPDEVFILKAIPVLELLEVQNSILISKEEEDVLIKHLVPLLKMIDSNLVISNKLSEKFIDIAPTFKFYLDKTRDLLHMEIVAVYDDIEINVLSEYEGTKYIFRKFKTEKDIVAKIERIGFSKDNTKNKFNFLEEDKLIFEFLKYEIVKLQEIGEVFYSDNIKKIKLLKKEDFNMAVSAGKENYFEFEFNVEGLTSKELLKIIDAFKNKTTFYKLKNGEFIDLENLELKKLLSLINVITTKNDILSGKTEFNNNLALYIDNYIKENKLTNIKGRSLLQNLKNDISDIANIKLHLSDNLQIDLRDYQKNGVKWFETLTILGSGGILADEMGLGKTVQTIAFLGLEISKNKNKKILIIAPTSLVYNWSSELDKFTSGIKYDVCIGNKTDRIDIINKFIKSDSSILITTYGMVRRDIDYYKEILFDFIIIDEAQNIKNSKSKITQCLKKLKSNNRFAITGTPLENSLLELWSIFDFIMPGYLKTEKEFNIRYNKDLKEENYILEELQKLIKPFILRRYKKDVLKELPDKIEKDMFIPLNVEQQKLYGVYSKYIKDSINNKSNDKQDSKIEILAYITKLRQLCLDPSIIFSEFTKKSSKIEILLELVKDKIEMGQKIIVFSQFTSVLRNIAKEFITENISYSYLDGTVSIANRQEEIKKFNNSITSVFLISTKAGGTGLNLTSANIVIHFDPWWNPAVEDQATDRAHRIGQEKNIEVIRFIAKNTIEEKIIKLQARKRTLINNILNSDSLNNNLLSFDEILELLTD